MDRTKERRQELAKAVREGARQLEPGARAAIELIGLLLAEAKDRLVAAPADEVMRAQGAAQQLQRLHHELTNTPASITPQPNATQERNR